LAVGVAVPSGGLTNTAGTGYDIAFQVRTEPIFGPVAIRIDVALNHFPGINGTSYTQMYGQNIGLIGDIGPNFYWSVAPGYYQLSTRTEVLGNATTEMINHFGGEAAIGVTFPTFGWRSYVEASASKLFVGGPSTIWFPLRFGVRL
jgi:hypothetical protein